MEREGAIYIDASPLKLRSDAASAARSLDDLPGPSGLPLIGNIHQIDPTRLHLVLEAWAAKYGPIYQFRLGPRRIVVTSDPALIEESYRARPELFRRQAHMDDILAELGIKGVFNAEGDAWRTQRRLSVAALAQRHVRELYPSIRTVATRLKARWDRAAFQGETLDVVEELKRFTVDVTMLIVFGHDSNTVESDDVIQRHLEVVFPGINRRLFALAPTWRYFRTSSDKRLDRALNAIRVWLDALLIDGRARLASDPDRAQKPSNFLEAMLKSVGDKGEPFPDDVIMSNLITMLLAGEDTTAYTLAWSVHHLCDSPEWVARIRSEADCVLGPLDTADSLETANKLAVANAVANETMRLRPVAPIGLIDANMDTTLGDYFVPKGTNIAVLTRLGAVDPANFVDPLGFRPERWLEDVDGPNALSVPIPFGIGPRICPGRSLALVEMKTLLSMLYKNFDVERAGAASDVTERFGFAMAPKGVKARLAPRRILAAAQ